MRRRSRPKANVRKPAPAGEAFTAEDVQLILSSPVYAYGTCGLQPTERVPEEVMKLNALLALLVRETGATFTLDDLDHRYQTLLRQLEDTGVFRRDEDLPPIITRELWLRAQLTTIQKLARGENRGVTINNVRVYISARADGQDADLHPASLTDISLPQRHRIQEELSQVAGVGRSWR